MATAPAATTLAAAIACAVLVLPSADSFFITPAARVPCLAGRRAVGCSTFSVQRRTELTATTTSDAGVVLDEKRRMRIDTLSFDLDGTLWPTEEVVWAANDKMTEFLNQRFPGTPDAKKVQSVMKDIRQRRREEAEAAGTRAAPVSYTELRLSALELVTLEAGFSPKEAEQAAQGAFQKWLDERNAAAGRLLFEGVQDMLSDLRRRYPSMRVCAITNGRGDVNRIPQLAEFFDFSISGEDEQVFPHRKPSEKIYVAAINRVLADQKGPCATTQGGEDTQAATRLPVSKEEKEAFASSTERWVHVGDDLANDVGPARKLGMRTVLVEADMSWRQGISTMSPEEEAQRLAQAAAARPHASIAKIASLPAVIDAWSTGST